MGAMSESSISSELEKDISTGLEKEIGHAHLSERDEDIIESLDPPFTVDEDLEKRERELESEERDGDDKEGASLAPVQSRNSINNLSAVPNGGMKAWLQVLGSFFVFFNTWGIINAVSRSPGIAY